MRVNARVAAHEPHQAHLAETFSQKSSLFSWKILIFGIIFAIRWKKKKYSDFVGMLFTPFHSLSHPSSTRSNFEVQSLFDSSATWIRFSGPNRKTYSVHQKVHAMKIRWGPGRRISEVLRYCNAEGACSISVVHAQAMKHNIFYSYFFIKLLTNISETDKNAGHSFLGLMV